MDDINRSVCQYEKEEKYYQDARSWYLNTFILPISEKAYLLILVVFYIVVVLIAEYYYSNTKPAEPTVNYMLFSGDITKTYSVIHPPTSSDTLPPQTRITEYLLGHYIQIRESYNIKNIKAQLEFVKNTTVENNYLNYENSMSINNPSSPLMIYQDAFDKTITIKKVDILKTEALDRSMTAIVYFQSNLRNIASNQMVYQDFVATISFKIDNIKELMAKDAKNLQFLVLNYKLHTIDKN